MNMDKAQETVVNEFNPYKIYEDLKSNNSLYTSCEKKCQRFYEKKK